MFAVPSASWQEAEKLKWSIAVAKGLRWSEFTMLGFVFGGAGTFDIIVTAAFDDVRLTGLRVGMPIFVSPVAALAPSIVIGGAWVATNDELTVRVVNVTAAPVNQPSVTWAYFGVIL